MKPQHIFEKIQIEPMMLHLKSNYDETNGRMVFWIDLFSGAGGTTTGIHLAKLKNTKVVACVNHDYNALLSHYGNHPNCLHFVEDVRNFKVVIELKKLVNELRRQFPGCIINLWASLECTNYSKAKGGLPRDADSRTLAHALFMYIEELCPDYIYIENVREFMSWGPLDENGRPISKMNGCDYVSWINTVKSYGYDHDYRLLNAADFGAYTSRERYFGVFAKDGLPIKWPKPTHDKSGRNGLNPWKAVRDVLDLEDEGKSIFIKKRAEKTHERVYAGLVKFVAGGEDLFTMQYNSGNDKNRVRSVNEPVGVITTSNRFAAVKSVFLAAHYSTGKNVHSIENPCPTVSTKDRFTKVEAQFMQSYYTGGGQLGSIEQPNPTLTGVPKQRLTTVNFLDQQFGNSKPVSIDNPANTITANPKQNLVTASKWIMDTNFSNVGQRIDQPLGVITANRKWHYLINPSWAGCISSIDKPSPVIIARQDKSPMYKATAITSNFFAMPIFEKESEIMKKIRIFMLAYGISDIKMRMLYIKELLSIQGFPKGYKLEGTQTEQKKFIGNAVVPDVAKALTESNTRGIEMYFRKVAV
jgi:DNA (cytosine-5)-methyltransferase 1